MIGSFLVQVFIAVFWLVTLPVRLVLRFKGPTKGSYVLVDVEGKVVDFLGPPRLFDLQALRARRTTLSLHWLDELASEVTKDDRIRGVVVMLHRFEGGMATAKALRDVLLRVKAKGREVVVHLPQGGGTKEAYVAAAADRVFLGPQATLAPLGFLVAARFFKRALDKLGVVPEVYSAGRFKSAGERFSRESMSEASREQTEAMLDAVHGEVVAALSAGRKVDPERATAMVDGAPYRGRLAKDVGLVDGVGYEDELPGLMAPGAPPPPSKERPLFLDAKPYYAARRALSMRRVLPRRAVGIIPVHGMITPAMGWERPDMAVDDRVIAAVRAARANPLVVAVVLHVDSPGGSALASDRIHHELEQLAKEKPLVAFFGDVAASGGYYVGAAAHTIVAQPTTITGSIGVVGARLVIQPLLERLGVSVDRIGRGARAKMLDSTLPFDDEARAVLDREIQETYRAFVEVVARGRKKTFEEIDAVAQGRVWMGKDALARGLVDELGGFGDALRIARERAGRHDAPPVLIRGKRKSTPLNPPELARREALAALAGLASTAGLDLSLLALSSKDEVLAWSPEASAFGAAM